MRDRDGDHGEVLEASVRAWVQDEHPYDPDLAQRAGRLAVELSRRGLPLADVCRTVFAFVADDTMPPEEAAPGGESQTR